MFMKRYNAKLALKKAAMKMYLEEECAECSTEFPDFTLYLLRDGRRFRIWKADGSITCSVTMGAYFEGFHR
ncbi:hypothetical protein VPHD249_0057 [Vibrio phage D249]|nr:hypothetical protein SIPHO041v1_p0059 [Vibrio phage 234P1]QZI88877.1 hypothetical protein SIPHO040v1_p0064 [Vibrio phage 70E35.6]QZI89144.1 hypothetical protein SIPHO042v1_p0147 [Vibrio phage 70E37.1]QZI89324.1 hypothetical protein SIPHO038v1_p0146 [Vibrio phage 70E37.6]